MRHYDVGFQLVDDITQLRQLKILDGGNQIMHGLRLFKQIDKSVFEPHKEMRRLKESRNVPYHGEFSVGAYFLRVRFRLRPIKPFGPEIEKLHVVAPLSNVAHYFSFFINYGHSPGFVRAPVHRYS